VNVVADLAGFIVEYRPVYQRHIQVYKGIDNVVQFRLLNADQKPIDTTQYTPRFIAFDENKNLVLDIDGVSLDDGSTTKCKGLFSITIPENAMLNFKYQYLSYSIILVDQDGKDVLTYTDSHFGNNGIIKVSNEIFPGPKASKVIETFNLVDNVLDSPYVSGAVDAEPGTNNNDALHTVAVYTNGYVGDVIVQATLENAITGTTVWSDVVTLTFDGTETEPTPANFTGVIRFLRIKTTADPDGTLPKVLVRN